MPASLPAALDGDTREADAQYYRRALHELIDMGMDLARRLHAAPGPAPAAPEPASPGPASPEPTPPAPDASAAFDRIARAVRRTILLARHLAEPAPPHAGPSPASREAARKRIIRAVEDAIHAKIPRPCDAERLHAELLERLDAPDLDDDIAGRPVADIIADIKDDLGIGMHPGARSPWKRRTPADLAILHARAAKPPASPPPAVRPPGPPPAVRPPGPPDRPLPRVAYPNTA